MFEKVIGHNTQKETLFNDIKENKISHAYAFVGPKGIGKRKMAEEMSKILLETEDLGVAIDYKEISKIDGKKNIIIEQIRKEIIDDVHIAPATGRHKLYVIDDADYMNEEAQNALLKTLEEPPSYVCIILVAENIQKFLPTIISRVKQISFSKLEDRKMEVYYKLNGLENSFDMSMKKYIDGSIGKLLSLKEESSYELFKQAEKLVGLFKNKEELNAIKLLDNISLKTTNILEYLEYLFYEHKMYDKINEIEKAKEKLIYNGNEDIVRTVMAINICRKEK